MQVVWYVCGSAQFFKLGWEYLMICHSQCTFSTVYSLVGVHIVEMTLFLKGSPWG